ncbi:MAG: phosphate ABC transporter permease subunit PstC [Oscillospiraceae bacterium]
MERSVYAESFQGESSAARKRDKVLRTLSKASDRVMSSLFVICGFASIALVIIITAFLVSSGVPAISEVGLGNFLLGKAWKPTAENAEFGILPFILSSFYATAAAVVLSVPLGILTAVFITKFAGEKVASVLSSAVEMLAGIPSVVYGLLGMIYVVPAVRTAFDLPDGACLFAAVIVLAVMLLPSVISVSASAIRTVPREYEEGSLALGANDTETIFKVTLPAAKSGISAAVVLGIGRAVGEAMAVMMVSGNVPNMPSLFGSVRFLTTAVASEMSYSSGLHREALFSVALVLFVFILGINMLLNFLTRKGKD